MKALLKGVSRLGILAGVGCAGIAGMLVFLIEEAPPGDGNSPTSGHGTRPARPKIPGFVREASPTVEEIAASYLGVDRERMLFDLIENDPDRRPEDVFRHAVAKNDLGMAESLGHCLGRLGAESRIPWIRELKPDAFRDAVIRGYIRGAAGVSPREVERALGILGRDKNDPVLWRLALLEIGYRNHAPTKDLVFDLIERFPEAGFSRIPAFEKLLGNLIANHDAKSVEKLLADTRFKAVGETYSAAISAALVAKDAEAAIHWAMSLENLDSRQRGMEAVFKDHVASGRGEDEMFTLVDRLASKKLPRGNMIRMIIASTVHEDPALAAQFLGSLPPNELNSRFYGTVTGKWYQQDGLAASKWVAELPVGPEKDSAIMVLVSELAEGDPETARVWAGSISDEGRRARALQNVANRSGKAQ